MTYDDAFIYFCLAVLLFDNDHRFLGWFCILETLYVLVQRISR